MLSKMRFRNCEFCQTGDFEIVNFVKKETLNFENMNFVKNGIFKMTIFGKIANFCPSVNCKLTHLSCHCDSVVVKILEHVDVDLDFWKICNTTYLRIDGAVSLDTRKGLIFLAFSWCNKKELDGRKSSSH